jgi:hypothetical protein
MGTVADRVHERHAIRREIQVVRGDDVAEGVTEDLSLGGAQVHVQIDPPLRTSDRIRLTFTLPDLADPVTVHAQVRWVSDVDRAYVGVQFISGFRAKETWALNRFIDGHTVQQGG